MTEEQKSIDPGTSGQFEESVTRSSKKGIIIAVSIVVFLAIIIYIALFGSSGKAYQEFQDNVFNPVHNKYHQAFWKCALKDSGENYSTPDSLKVKISKNSQDAAYIDYITKTPECLPLLSEGVGEYEKISNSLKTPPEYVGVLKELSNDINGLQSGWGSYIEFLKQKQNNQNVDADRENKLLNGLATYYFNYQKNYNELLKITKTQTGN